MSEQEAKRFIAAVEADAKLKDKLEGMSKNPEAVYKEVISLGFDCTPEEIKAELLENSGQSLSDADLAKVAAGLTNEQKVGFGMLGGVAAVAVVACAAAAI